MTYQPQDLSPYSSHIVAKRRMAVQDLEVEIEALLLMALEIVDMVVEHPRSVTGNIKVSGTVTGREIVGPWKSALDMYSVACVYTEDRPVTWLPSNAKRDKLHHLLVISATTDGLLLITATDAEHRSALLTHLQRDYFAPWESISQAVLVKALVEGKEMKTLWLAGVHRDTPVKPSAKILSGSDLRDAIDPMNDSSFLAGAVRSTAGGVSLRNSSVWSGPNSTIQDFETRSVSLLDTLRTAILAAPAADLEVHAGLARWVDSINGASGCYFIAHSDPETLDRANRHRAERINSDFVVELDAPGAPAGKPAWAFSAKVTARATQTTTVIEVTPELTPKCDRVVYRIDSLPAAPFDEWVNAVKDSAVLLRTYYDTGHTIAGGTLSQVRIQDLPFRGFVYGNFSNYVVTKEKPQTLAGAQLPLQTMMDPNDDSLFKWIFKDGLALLGLAAPAPGVCWLFCDDGSSEVADFVHLDVRSMARRLTLFHAKGATSASANRRSVPGPYELVASQAIKNLRALDAQQLMSRIKGRLATNGANRIWDQPWQPNLLPTGSANAFETALDQLGFNYDCEVVIVQPHVRRTDFEPGVGIQSQTVGARQLRTLLFGVESLARSVSARFRVVADDT